MLLGNIIQNIALTKLVVLWFGRKLPTESGSDGFAGYCWPDGSSGIRAGRAHRSHTLLAGNTLPPHHPLQRLGLQVNHNNSCIEPMHMEEQYYSKKIRKTQCFPKLPWPLLCFHCGSADQVACQICIAAFAITHFGLQVETPQSIKTSFPQCSSCRNKGTPPHETGKAVQNVRAAKAVEANK